MDGASLLAGQKGNRLSTEIFAYASDAENGIRDFFAQTVNVDLSSARERLERGGLKFWGQLALPAGDYRIRVLVRNAETGRMGLVLEPVRVPEFSGKTPYLAPPVFLEKSETGLSVRSPSAAPAALAGESTCAMPGASPRRRGPARHAPGNSGKARAPRLQLFRPRGRPVENRRPGPVGRRPTLGQAEIEVLGKSPADGTGKQVLLLAFHPPALAAGPLRPPRLPSRTPPPPKLPRTPPPSGCASHVATRCGRTCSLPSAPAIGSAGSRPRPLALVSDLAVAIPRRAAPSVTEGDYARRERIAPDASEEA